ncbi:heterokaryon incompatibility protein [Ophiostoma piceae UAMH 11346]|uniref:Heterokaryon incompatibility protein n=1 Tax=Ophiostoma piceae (strain UAMH 11346) TaxID=1262450 RepID=S3D9T0_OPHP1|nr:heterokaryon incompatibility protein [Ophiostoma piceae UAMH 11346]
MSLRAQRSAPSSSRGLSVPYQPLRQDKTNNDIQEMRLLSIDDAFICQPSGRLISCTMRTCPVSTAQKTGYFALSYVWGDAQDTQPIVVNGRTFKATRNLVEALRHVCAINPECCSGLWVDAICINQHDDKEKSSQVALMRHIYAGALETLAWLGPGDTSSSAAIRLVNLIWEDDDIIGRGGKAPRPEKLMVRDVCDLIDTLEDTRLISSDVFSQRPYWTRIWTIQEGLLGKSCRLIAGADSCFLHSILGIMDWVMSDESSEFLDRDPDESDDALTKFQNMVRYIRHDAETGLPIPSLRATLHMAYKTGHGSVYSDMKRAMICLQMAADRKATNPLDMVFGLSGLVDVGLEIDYSVSVKELYSSTARLFIAQVDYARHLLNWAGIASHESTLCLPSWAPDWSISPRIRPIRGSNKRSEVPPSHQPLVSGETLRVRGVCIGVIQSTNELGIFPGNMNKRSGTIYWTDEQLCGRISSAAEYLVGGNAEEVLDIILSEPPSKYRHKYDKPIVTTLLHLLKDPDERHDAAHDLISLIQCFVRTRDISLCLDVGNHADSSAAIGPGHNIFSTLFDENRTEPVDRNAFLHAAAHQFQNPTFTNSLLGESSVTGGYVLLRTTNGRCGYSREGVQAGDVVYMAGGCSDLLVLRPTGKHFTYLATGCIVGFGGQYPIDWDNPPGDIEIVDIK